MFNRAVLESLISSRFLICAIGDADLFYDAKSGRLHWRSSSGEIVTTRFKVGHRISFNLEAPKRGFLLDKTGHREIANNVYKHRMQADEEEMLSLPSRYTSADVKRSRTALALAYHPDRYPEADELMKDVLTRRMQEGNSAADRVLEKLARKK